MDKLENLYNMYYNLHASEIERETSFINLAELENRVQYTGILREEDIKELKREIKEKINTLILTNEWML